MNTVGPTSVEETQEERIEKMKIMFASLEIDNRAIFADWCHENIKTGAGEYFAKKAQGVNDKMNAFIASATDKISSSGSKIYNATNEAFKNIGSKDSEIFD